MRVLRGHSRAVRALAFSPDGRLLASADAAGCVSLWDVLSGGEGSELVPATRYGGEMAMVFAADNRHLIVSRQNEVTVWDTRKPERIQEFCPQTHFLFRAGVALLADGTLVLVRADREAGIHLLEPVTWTEITRWEPPEFGTNWFLLAVEPGGSRVATGHGYVIEVRTGKVLGRWGKRVKEPAEGEAAILCWCPGKDLLAVCERGKTIRIVNPIAAAKVTTLTSPTKSSYEAITFTPDGRHLIAVGNDQTARLYDTTTWEVRQTLDWGIGPLRSVAVTADGSRAAAGGGSREEGRIVLWDLD